MTNFSCLVGFSNIAITGVSTAWEPIYNGAPLVWISAEDPYTLSIIRSGGTLSDLYLNISSNNNTGSTTFTFRKNDADGNQTLSVSANTTGSFHDATHTDSVASGDKTDVQIAIGNTTQSVTVSILSFVFSSSVNTVSRCINNLAAATQFSSASTTYFISPIGATYVLGTTESTSKNRQQKSATFKNCQIFVFSNSNASAATWRSRKNGANGNISISVPINTTGSIEDTTHSDSVVAGDDYNYSYTTGTGTVANEIFQEWIDYVSSNGDFIFSCMKDGGQSFNTAVTQYFGLSGDLSAGVTTESNAQNQMNQTPTISSLTANVTSNNITNPSTLTLRANGADTALVVSIGASQTGVVSDNIDTYTASSTDLVNYKLVTAAQGTTMTISHISSWGNNVPASPSTPTGFPYSFKNLIRRAMDWKIHTFGAQRSTFGI